VKKIIIINFIILFLASFSLQVHSQIRPDEKIFQDAKILIFDEKWESAQKKLEELISKYPQSPWRAQAVFYKAKCLEEQEGKEEGALAAYKEFLKLESDQQSLREDAEVSIIDLASELYQKGKKSYLGEIEKRLASSNKVVRYYAAFELSYAKDKKVAVEGIPVLKEILAQEKDPRLRDRAKIALLRINPDTLQDIEEESYRNQARILKIRVYEKPQKKLKLSLNIPWALADLALGAIPAEEKALMCKKGYDLDKIIHELTRIKGNIIEIEGEETIIKMWID